MSLGYNFRNYSVKFSMKPYFHLIFLTKRFVKKTLIATICLKFQTLLPYFCFIDRNFTFHFFILFFERIMMVNKVIRFLFWLFFCYWSCLVKKIRFVETISWLKDIHWKFHWNITNFQVCFSLVRRYFNSEFSFV
jgi:hypothetical protein